jgi:hypothetical protein
MKFARICIAFAAIYRCSIFFRPLRRIAHEARWGEGLAADEKAIRKLDDIEDHNAGYSQDPPYSVLEIIVLNDLTLTRAREGSWQYSKKILSRSFLRSSNFLPRSGAILRNAARIPDDRDTWRQQWNATQ